MEESSKAKEADQTVNGNSIIDLVDDSDEEAVKEAATARKRKSSSESNIIDLVDDEPTDEDFNLPRADTSTKKRPRTSNAEVINLVDPIDNENNGETSNHSSGAAVHQEKEPNKDTQRNEQKAILSSGDRAILTNGIPERIHNIMLHSNDSCWTCFGSNATTDWKRVSILNNGTHSLGSPAHLQQPDVWSCGYRNYQMMLSALLPRLSPNHSIFSKLPRTMPPILPTVAQIQSSMEYAWKNEGFDPDGARHFQYRIRNKTGNAAKIGAIEVANVCWYHGIDAAVVQFVKCTESRRLLPWFVLAYFIRNRISSEEEASGLTGFVLLTAEAWSRPNGPSIQKITAANGNGQYMKTPATQLPLYLQWEGHSVTVVGIEIPNNSMSTANLLILDPLKKTQTLLSDLNSGTSSQPSNTAQPQQASRLPECVKLPWQQISRKDLQIVLCTERSMPYAEREACRGDGIRKLPLYGRVKTAAQDAVQRHLA